MPNCYAFCCILHKLLIIKLSRPAQSTALPPLQEKFGRQDCAIAQALSKEA